MKHIIVFVTILLSACIPLTAPQDSVPTAYIDSSYPTVQSAPITNIQTTSGIEVRADTAWRDGKQVNANVCFTLLDGSDWSVSGATLQYAGAATTDFSSTLLSLQEPVEGQSGLRCDTLSFLNIPPDADLTTVTVTVDAIAAMPRAEDYCSIYMPKIQQALNDRAIAITLGCVDSNGAQVMQILSRPDTMLQEEAEQLVYSDEFYTVKGPWAFTFNLGQ
ncbi:MAG: hypothetical protein ABI904_07870 [Chloroflexota bacterium]